MDEERIAGCSVNRRCRERSELEGRAGRADIRRGQHTLGVCQTGIRFCRVFDDRQRAVAAPSCNGRRVSDVLAVRGRACGDSWKVRGPDQS